MKKISFLTLLMLCALIGYSQEQITDFHASNYRTWSLGLNVGGNYSLGDSPNLFSAKPDAIPDDAGGFLFGIRGHLTKFFNPTFGVRGSAGYHQLGGYKIDQYYEGDNISVSASVMINLSNLMLRGREFERKNSFLFGAGTGFSLIQTTGFNADGTPRGTFGTGSFQGTGDGSFDYAFVNSIPLTLTYKRMLSKNLDLDISYRHEILTTDNVDLLQDVKSNDGMAYLSVGLTYNFKNKNDTSAAHVIYTNPLDKIFGIVDKARKDFESLSSDDDGDGVSNYYDKDNSTQDGTIVDGSGRAIDSDQDGIPDYMDEDPFTVKGAEVDENGRAVDSDGDGVPDHMDKEPNTPSGALVNFQGKEIKQGGGGVGFSSGYLPSVYFAFNSATVTAANHQRLAAVARTLKANPDISVKVVGFADKTGPEEYNRKLSERRAQAVVNQLTKVYGLDESRFSIESEGEGNPLGSRRDINRRVDIMPQ